MRTSTAASRALLQLALPENPRLSTPEPRDKDVIKISDLIRPGGLSDRLKERRVEGAVEVSRPPRVRVLLERVDPRLADLRVLWRGDAGDSDRANELAVDDDGDPPLERARPPEAQDAQVDPALRDPVLEHLGRTAIRDGRVGLVVRDLDAAELGAVEPLAHHEVAPGVQDGDDHEPVVLLRLRPAAD